jgi:hypothetical protein
LWAAVCKLGVFGAKALAALSGCGCFAMSLLLMGGAELCAQTAAAANLS